MPVQLLDVNVLLALAWQHHADHESAQRWFETNASQGWATCPLTQCGFVRISSNRRFYNDAISPSEANTLLRELTRHPSHSFWSDSISLPQSMDLDWRRITGHQQITDAYLVALATSNRGQLATFDQKLATFHSEAIVLIDSA